MSAAPYHGSIPKVYRLKSNMSEQQFVDHKAEEVKQYLKGETTNLQSCSHNAPRNTYLKRVVAAPAAGGTMTSGFTHYNNVQSNKLRRKNDSYTSQKEMRSSHSQLGLGSSTLADPQNNSS